MVENLALGLAMTTVCVVIQCFVVSFLLRVMHVLDGRALIRPTLPSTAGVLVAVLLIMLAGNMLQMTLWACLFRLCGEFGDFREAFYHSVVNFSTLGYGDLVMSEENRLLGGLEAVNGVLMFGLTTSVSFVIMSKQMQAAWEIQKKKREERMNRGR